MDASRDAGGGPGPELLKASTRKSRERKRISNGKLPAASTASGTSTAEVDRLKERIVELENRLREQEEELEFYASAYEQRRVKDGRGGKPAPHAAIAEGFDREEAPKRTDSSGSESDDEAMLGIPNATGQYSSAPSGEIGPAL